MVTYQDYLRYVQQFQGSEGGSGSVAIPESQWNALSIEEKWNSVGQLLILTPDDPRYAELKPQVGGEPGRNIFIGTPNVDREQDDALFVNPDAVVRTDDYIAFSDDNRTPFSQESDSFSTQDYVRFAAMFAAAAGGAAFATGGFGGAAGADVLAAAPGQGFGTAAGTASNLGGGAGAGAAGAGWGVSAEGSGGAGAGGSGGSTTTGVGTGAAEGAGTGAGAGTGTGAGGGAGGGGGWTLSAEGSAGVGAGGSGATTAGSQGFLGNITNWYNNLSPASRLILGTAVSQGAGALLQGHAQREQQRFIQDQRDQQEEDRRRRSAIPAFRPGSFTPKPPGTKSGIIDSRRGG